MKDGEGMIAMVYENDDFSFETEDGKESVGCQTLNGVTTWYHWLDFDGGCRREIVSKDFVKGFFAGAAAVKRIPAESDSSAAGRKYKY